MSRHAMNRLGVLLAAATTIVSLGLAAQPLNITTLAGPPGGAGWFDGTGSGARFNSPSSVAADRAGNVYVADRSSHTIRKIEAATGVVTTLAGLAGNSGSADGKDEIEAEGTPLKIARWVGR